MSKTQATKGWSKMIVVMNLEAFAFRYITGNQTTLAWSQTTQSPKGWRSMRVAGSLQKVFQMRLQDHGVPNNTDVTKERLQTVNLEKRKTENLQESWTTYQPHRRNKRTNLVINTIE